jgi:uncharacterized cofD-like protein
MSNKSSVVVIGGGTGTFAVLSALRDQNVSLTALMTMVYDGGSNKILRDEFGLLPTSGIRQAIVALSENQTLMRDLFMYRFHQGNGISGMTFGNLFLAAMADILGSQAKAFNETAKLLNVKGKILPISFDNVRLVADYTDGSQVIGEHLIDEPEHDGTLKITGLSTKPEAKISPESNQAILTADFIILGPGDFYTNTIANLVVKGVPDAIQKSQAKLIFITNLMTKYGDAYNYRASDYLADLNHYLPLSRLNYILINNDSNYPQAALAKYQAEHAMPVIDDFNQSTLPNHLNLIRVPLISNQTMVKENGDSLNRSIIRHDITKLGQALKPILSLKDYNSNL